MDKLAELEKELLADMEENPVEYKETVSNIFEIDSNLRTINIPITVKNIGVESDDDVKRLEFTIPREYGEFDLSQFRIRINYMNANGDKSIYLVEDKKVSGDNITFSWLVGRNVTKYKGQVNFIVCLKLSDEKGEILKELNTTLCRLEVLEGLEVVPVIDEKTTDIIEQLLRMVETETTGAVQKVTEEGNKQVKEVQKAAQEIVADREQIQKNAESVTVLKEDLHMITSVGKNLFNPSTLVDGYLNADGSIHENGIDMDWNTTDFIEVEPEKKIVTSKKSNDGIRRKITMFFLTEFDAGKKVIKHTASSEKLVIDLLENSKFVRFSIHKAEINEIQTEQNNDMTTYESYEKKVGKDNLSREFVEEFEALKRLKWQGKKWACLGDSLTEKNIRTTKHYHDYIAESTGIAVFNMGVGGTGYKRTEENYTAFYQRAVKLPVDCDVVTIFGSGNDLSLIKQLGTPTDVETTTICGCINKAIDEIIKIKPTVALGIVSPTPWVGNQPTVDDSNAMAKYTKALHDICKIRSIPFLDLYHCSNLRPWTSEGRNACYTKDDGNGVHPDENGHKLIAPRFKIFLEQLII